MGLLPLRGPPKPQPYENTKRFVRRCRSLFSSVLLSGAQGGSLSASHTNHPFCAARCLPGRRRSGRANDFYSFSSGQTACRKSCAFAPGCRRTGLSARSPHTAVLGGRFALHASARALRGIAGLFQMKKERLRAKSRAFSAVVRRLCAAPIRACGRGHHPFFAAFAAWPALCCAKMHGFATASFFPGRSFSFFAFFDRLKNHFFSTATQISQV